MTVQDYNTKFCRAHNKAVMFIQCLDHALEKSDDNARMQLQVIGWDEQTKQIILHALTRLQDDVKDSLRWENSNWWADEIRKLKEVQDATIA